MESYFVSGSFESLLQLIDADLVTECFFYTSIFIFAFSFGLGFKAKKPEFVANVPTLLTSLGILGTFIGIVIGLLDFDSADIDKSVPLLLDGLKTAFNTSLVGMFLAILFKLIDNLVFVAKRSAVGQKDDVSPKDIYAVMAVNNQLVQTLIDNQNSNSDRLWTELSQFAEMMSKSATEQVVEALNNVISDFNNNLTEQFGENFKALDNSVKKLVEWQEQHVDQLDAMIAQYGEGVRAISETSNSLETIGEQCVQIPSAMTNLSSVLEVNQHQIQELQRHLNVFSDMRDKAVEAVPQIENNVRMVSEQLVNGASEMREVMVEGATQFSDSVNGVNASLLNTGSQIQSQSTDIGQLLQDTATDMNNSLRNILATMSSEMSSMKEALEQSNQLFSESVKKVVTNMSQELETVVRGVVADTGSAVNKEVKMIDESLQNEINRTMQQLGESLTAITRVFLNDYRELTDNMKRVVAIQVD